MENSPSPVFKEVTRIDATKLTDEEIIEQVHVICVEQGIPLVIENYHLKKEFDSELFTITWLRQNYGEYEIITRDMNKNLDEPMSLSNYLDYVEKTKDHTITAEQMLYGKDIICPNPWKDYVGKFLPNYFKYHGTNDLMSNMHPDLRADNLMLYIGIKGTKQDICAAFGHNLMVYTDPDSWSTWYMVGRDDREKMTAFIRQKDHNIDLENYYAPPDILSQTDFTVYHTKQRVGDFILVPSECCHEVINEGGCTIKVSWNRLTPHTVALALTSSIPNYRRVLRPETYQIKRVIYESIVKWSEALSPNLRRPFNRKKSNRSSTQSLVYPTRMKNSPGRDIQKEYKILLNAYKYILDQEWVPNSQWEEEYHVPTTQDSRQHLSCDFCHCDLWNRHLHCYKCVTETGSAYDICLECYAERRGCVHPLTLRDGFKMQRIIKVYNNAKKAYISKWGEDDEIKDLEDLEDSVGSLAYNRWKASLKLKKEEQLEVNNAVSKEVFISPYEPIFEEPVKVESKDKKDDQNTKKVTRKKARKPRSAKGSTTDPASDKSLKRKKSQKTKDKDLNSESRTVKRRKAKSDNEEKKMNLGNELSDNTLQGGSTSGMVDGKPEDCDYIRMVRDFFFIDNVLGLFVNQDPQQSHHPSPANSNS
ncbi:2921_t:CDS:10 [Acaulospora morrowiae]|uniref:2921_t:CDS:1 n=1 Tax=Acaulospora morrowiae TaxID=94023 RepID=A0A9N9GD43_9GLOM|nr:2921_t:CDS:10 [Acaulospora morrowiae]